MDRVLLAIPRHDLVDAGGDIHVLAVRRNREVAQDQHVQ